MNPGKINNHNIGSKEGKKIITYVWMDVQLHGRKHVEWQRRNSEWANTTTKWLENVFLPLRRVIDGWRVASSNKRIELPSSLMENRLRARAKKRICFCSCIATTRSDECNFPSWPRVTRSLRSLAVRLHNAKYLHKVMKTTLLWSARVAKQKYHVELRHHSRSGARSCLILI